MFPVNLKIPRKHLSVALKTTLIILVVAMLNSILSHSFHLIMNSLKYLALRLL